jgi:hypothetical protein
MSALVHVVLMRLRSQASRADLADLTDRLRALTASVAGPGSCVVGRNVSEEPLAQGFDFGFVLTFPSRGALDAYHVNPAHLPISLAIRALATTVLVFDVAA